MGGGSSKEHRPSNPHGPRSFTPTRRDGIRPRSKAGLQFHSEEAVPLVQERSYRLPGLLEVPQAFVHTTHNPKEASLYRRLSVQLFYPLVSPFQKGSRSDGVPLAGAQAVGLKQLNEVLGDLASDFRFSLSPVSLTDELPARLDPGSESRGALRDRAPRLLRPGRSGRRPAHRRTNRLIGRPPAGIRPPHGRRARLYRSVRSGPIALPADGRVLGRQGPECGPTPLRSWRRGCGLERITAGNPVGHSSSSRRRREVLLSTITGSISQRQPLRPAASRMRGTDPRCARPRSSRVV